MNASIGVVGVLGLDVAPVVDLRIKSADRDLASNKKVKKLKKISLKIFHEDDLDILITGLHFFEDFDTFLTLFKKISTIQQK